MFFPPRILHINDLHAEVLLTIFNFFPLPARLALRLVCRQWKSLALCNITELSFGCVQSHPSLHIEPDNRLYFNDPFTNDREIDRLIQAFAFLIRETRLSLRKLVITRVPNHRLKQAISVLVSIPPEDSAPSRVRASEPSHPMLTHLDLENNSIKSDQLNRLLKRFGPNLEGFYCHFPPSKGVWEFLKLLRADKLTEIGWKQSDNAIDLCNRFPLLNKLTVRCTESVAVYRPSFEAGRIDFDSLKKLAQLKELTILGDNYETNEFFGNQLVEQPVADWQLSSFAIIRIQNFSPFPIGRLSLISRLDHLRRLHVHIDQASWSESNAALQFIGRLHRLEEVEIRAHSQVNYADFALLANLKQLKTFSIHLQAKHQLSLEAIVNALPPSMPSVTSFRLGWRSLVQTDIFLATAKRIEIFPNLQRLHFQLYTFPIEKVAFLVHHLSRLNTLLIKWERNCSSRESQALREMCREKQIALHMCHQSSSALVQSSGGRP